MSPDFAYRLQVVDVVFQRYVGRGAVIAESDEPTLLDQGRQAADFGFDLALAPGEDVLIGTAPSYTPKNPANFYARG